MTHTINGIGTHHYGKRNLDRRSARCQNCGATANLESYDTRLFFVVLFMPIIPLARKRIIDQCPKCTWHWAMSIQQYESSRQERVAAGEEQYQHEPTPEGAAALHGTLLGYRLFDEAERFRGQALCASSTIVRKSTSSCRALFWSNVPRGVESAERPCAVGKVCRHDDAW